MITTDWSRFPTHLWRQLSLAELHDYVQWIVRQLNMLDAVYGRRNRRPYDGYFSSTPRS